jgi:Cys-tRNA(Pro)/Cys-tRNA(Cys) deacylase
MAAGGTRALDELGRAGVVHTVHEYAPHEPTGVDRGHGPAWGEDAAAALGVDPARIHKTRSRRCLAGAVVARIARTD